MSSRPASTNRPLASSSATWTVGVDSRRIGVQRAWQRFGSTPVASRNPVRWSPGIAGFGAASTSAFGLPRLPLLAQRSAIAAAEAVTTIAPPHLQESMAPPNQPCSRPNAGSLCGLQDSPTAGPRQSIRSIEWGARILPPFRFVAFPENRNALPHVAFEARRMRITVVALLLAAAGYAVMRPAPTASTVASTPAPASPAEELRRIGTELYAGQCPQYGRAPRETFEGLLADPSMPNGKRIPTQIDLASEYLEAGEVPRAIELLEKTVELAKKCDNARQEKKAMRDLARAWLREAENENCIERHNADCCIFPPREGAIHSVRAPAERARNLYQAVLAEQPENRPVRWLVTVTTLVLGESMDELPVDQRIPMSAFGEAKGEPLFRDVAGDAGVDARSLAGGVAVEDFDGDGWYDVLTSTCDPLGSMHYFHSRGDGKFEDLSEAVGVSKVLGGLNMLSADYDADGDQDALVLRGGWLLDYGQLPRSLLRNDEGKEFVDVSKQSGMWEPFRPSMAAAFGDYDDDGDLDLYIGNESRVEIEEDHKGDYPSQLMVNDGVGVFGDEAVRA